MKQKQNKLIKKVQNIDKIALDRTENKKNEEEKEEEEEEEAEINMQIKYKNNE